MRLETIFNRADIKEKLENKIFVLQKELEFSKILLQYFKDNNIETYKKFDKRDFDKILDYFNKSDFKLYYNHCQDNTNIHYKKDDINGSKYINLYVNNQVCYNSEVKVVNISFLGEITFTNVLEITTKNIEYITKNLDQNKKLLDNFDNVITEFNNKVKELKKFVDDTSINNIIDIYIYASDNV